MRCQSSPFGALRPLVSSARPLIALGALLCFLALIAASGPHLVHHLADQHPVRSHSHAGKSQPPDCLVLASVQHSPMTEPQSVPTAIVLPGMEGPSVEAFFQVPIIRRLTFRARSPPTLLCP
jgi:hypothetical protein